MNDLGIPSIDELMVSLTDAVAGREAMVQALVEREEALADAMRMAGVQFGLYPQIVAEVLAQLQFGRPLPDDERQMIHTQFHMLMEELSRQQGQ